MFSNLFSKIDHMANTNYLVKIATERVGVGLLELQIGVILLCTMFWWAPVQHIANDKQEILVAHFWRVETATLIYKMFWWQWHTCLIKEINLPFDRTRLNLIKVGSLEIFKKTLDANGWPLIKSWQNFCWCHN